MYENHKLCPDLKASDICLVVERYENGPMVRVFHEHVPKYRLSNESRFFLLRALVTHFSGMAPESIVAGYLNGRGKKPERRLVFQIQTEYPEAGVVRRYCGANTIAWSDEVISPGKFRK